VFSLLSFNFDFVQAAYASGIQLLDMIITTAFTQKFMYYSMLFVMSQACAWESSDVVAAPWHIQCLKWCTVLYAGELGLSFATLQYCLSCNNRNADQNKAYIVEFGKKICLLHQKARDKHRYQLQTD
jgi:hypothetical protein